MSIESLNSATVPEEVLKEALDLLQQLENVVKESPQAITLSGEEEQPAPYLTGRANKVKTAKGTRLDTDLAIIEAADLIASHDALGNANPAYPAELQPRDRSRQSSQQQIQSIAGNLDPESLGRSGRADSGAPIIGPDLVVESGNGRTIAIKLAYQRDNAQEYKDWLIESAEYLGFNPEAIQVLKEPILVRVRKTDVDRKQFTIEANQDDKLSYSATERAKTDAGRLSGDLLALFNPSEDGDLLAASNQKFIQGFLKALGQDEAAQYITTDGKPTQALLMRIKSAVFNKAYNDDRLTEMVADQTKPDLQNVLNALSVSAPKFIEAQAISQSVKGQLEDISSGIVDSIEKSLESQVINAILDATNVLEKAKQSNQAVTEYVEQLGLFGDLPEGVPELAVFLSKNARSAKKMAIVFKAMASFVEREAVNGQNFDLFGEPVPMSVKDALDYANQELEKAYGSGAVVDMFDDVNGEQNFLGSEAFAKIVDPQQPESVMNSQTPGFVALDRLKITDVKSQPIEALSLAAEVLSQAQTTPLFQQQDPRVYHETRSGKVLAGIVLDSSLVKRLEQAKQFDKYTFFYKDKNNQDLKGGWFIRTEHLANIPDDYLTHEQINFKRELTNATDTTGNQNTAGQMGAGSGRESNPGHGSGAAADLARSAGGPDAGTGDQRDSDPGLSNNNATGQRSGGNRSTTRTSKRSITSADPQAANGSGSSVSHGAGSSTRSKRDRSTLQSAKSIRAGLSAKEQLQLDADGTATAWGDLENIQTALPYLLPEQQDDVLKAEQRLLEQNQNGILFTNGTGTGKTFTGLGNVKRFVNAGKKNILIVSMNDKIVRDFVKSGKALNLNIHQLKSTTDNGGEKHSIVATTYANFGQNRSLALKEWDLIIVDESHNLMQSENGNETGALRKLRALTGHHAGFYEWFNDRFQDIEPERELQEVKILDDDGKVIKTELQPTGPFKPGPAMDHWTKKQAEEKIKWQSRWISQGSGRAKVIFLSATPFSYIKTLEWSEGYLFHFTKPENLGDPNEVAKGAKYNSGGSRENFYMMNFGYTMRYNKLTRPDSKVDPGVNERAFNERLKAAGAVSGRDLQVSFDYDRKFVLIESAVGKDIDRGLEILRESKSSDGQRKFGFLSGEVLDRFDYLSRQRLLEAIKADAAIEQIKKHIALGRKVVVFHDYKHGGGFSPFKFSEHHFKEPRSINEYSAFEQEHPDLVGLNLSFNSTIVTLRRAFPNALLFNGDISKPERSKNADLFNTDNNGHNLIVVQTHAGSTGISFHDTTGVHQRVIINLGLPQRPALLRQTEGRIYRVGQASNAIQRYLTTGTKWETQAFANTIAQRAETVDNLARGDDATVSIKEAIINAYNEAEYFEPSLTDGIGGKAYEEEHARIARLSPFDKAKTFYYNKGKNRDNRANKIGKDWYATPEPLGMKMVEWSGAHHGDDVLEPSAGDGAIGRWFPTGTNVTMVEQSNDLAARAKLSNASANVITGSFEDLNTINKYHSIVMNPPFGHAGATALEHVKKASRHLYEGGRIVALVPTSPNLDKGLEAWLDSYGNNMFLIARIDLPRATFVNANTSVSTQILILEQHESTDDVPNFRRLDFSNAETVEELFERIENVTFQPRKNRKDEDLMDYGLVLSPYRKNYVLNGVGVTHPEIREVLLNVRGIYETDDPNTLEVYSSRNVPMLIKALKEKGLPKIKPDMVGAFDSWRHDGLYDNILVKSIVMDKTKYVKREKMPTIKTPVVVIERDHHYELVVGYERFKLAQQKQDDFIPAIVIFEEEGINREAIITAYQRSGTVLDPISFANHLFDILDKTPLVA